MYRNITNTTFASSIIFYTNYNSNVPKQINANYANYANFHDKDFHERLLEGITFDQINNNYEDDTKVLIIVIVSMLVFCFLANGTITLVLIYKNFIHKSRRKLAIILIFLIPIFSTLVMLCIRVKKENLHIEKYENQNLDNEKIGERERRNIKSEDYKSETNLNRMNKSDINNFDNKFNENVNVNKNVNNINININFKASQAKEEHNFLSILVNNIKNNKKNDSKSKFYDDNVNVYNIYSKLGKNGNFYSEIELKEGAIERNKRFEESDLNTNQQVSAFIGGSRINILNNNYISHFLPCNNSIIERKNEVTKKNSIVKNNQELQNKILESGIEGIESIESPSKLEEINCDENINKSNKNRIKRYMIPYQNETDDKDLA